MKETLGRCGLLVAVLLAGGVGRAGAGSGRADCAEAGPAVQIVPPDVQAG